MYSMFSAWLLQKGGFNLQNIVNHLYCSLYIRIQDNDSFIIAKYPLANVQSLVITPDYSIGTV